MSAVRIAELIDFSHRLYRLGYAAGLDGNLSSRLSDGRLLVTRSGCHKGLLTAADVLTVAADGAVLHGEGTPTSELSMHLACYTARPDAGAVIHAHPPHAIACTLAGVSLQTPVLPRAVIALGAIPTLPYTRTGTGDLASQVEGAIWSYPAVMLERHGAVALGVDLLDAFCNMEALENTARILLLTHSVRPPEPIGPEEANALEQIGRRRRRLKPL